MDYWSSFQIDSDEELKLCEWIIECQLSAKTRRIEV